MKVHPLPIVIFVVAALTTMCLLPPSIARFSSVISYLVFWVANYCSDCHYDTNYSSVGNNSLVANET